MRFKLFYKYLLAGSLMTLPKGISDFHKTDMPAHAYKIEQTELFATQAKIDAKARELCDTYIDFVLQGQQNIKSRRGGYYAAVSKELPGAPLGWHCIYGQYIQLNRALEKMGDTITLVPFTSRNACPTFRSEMRKKYSAPEYNGAIHNGKMFRSDAEYNRALAAFLKHNHITDSVDAQKRNSVIARFEKNNFKASCLHPGAIIIVQHNNTPSNTHAIMYLGRGRIENDKFVADENGGFIYAGYNNESVGDIFKTYNTNHIFAADIYNIARVDYAKELNRVTNMDDKELFRFVYDMPSDLCLAQTSHQQLETMAREKYFNKQNYAPAVPVIRPNMAMLPVFPLYNEILNIRTK